MENIRNAIEVRNMSKDFKLIFDKPTTLKERLVFWNREKPKWHHVLKNINLDIKKGDTVALCGATGYATGNHCHFEVRVNGEYTDPWSYLARNE